MYPALTTEQWNRRARASRRRGFPGRSGAWLTLALLALLAVATGCRRQPPAGLVIVNGAEPESLDPHLVTGQTDGRVALALFEGLTRYDEHTGSPVPGLADRWEITDGGREYTFHIRTNAAWSNGEPLGARDFAWSWQRALDPATACEYAGALFYIENAESYAKGALKDFAQVGIRAEDERTLQVRLTSPTPFFLDLCAYTPFVALPRKAIEQHGDRWLMARPFMASGAYELVSWRLNDRIRVRRNPHYWDAGHTQTEVVDLLPCISPNTALNLYFSGAADIVWDKELIPPDLVSDLRQRADFHVSEMLGNYFYRYNVTKPPFNDPRVRRALALVIDRRRIVEHITKGGEKIANAITPGGVANGPLKYQPPAGLGRDPEAARRLLAEAGFPGGKGFPRFTYTFNTHEGHRKIAVELRDMWLKELGIEAELRQLEWKTYLRAQFMLEYDLVRSSWIGDYDDPNTFLDLFMSENPNNRTGWKNAGYDTALRAANAEADPARRQVLLHEAESILVEKEAPVVPLFFYVGMELYDEQRIEGVFPNIRAEHPLRAIRRVRQP